MREINFTNIFNVIKSIAIIGSAPQSFLDAKWVLLLLRACPKSKKRKLALRILSLSPHYFYRHVNPDYAKMPYDDFLEAESNRNATSRQNIFQFILKPYAGHQYSVLDYGCGPGYLAKIVSKHVKQVYAVDISRGVLGCAKIINGSQNLEFVHIDDISNKIDNNNLDLIYSFAVIQHVTDESFEQILTICFHLLKSNGTVVFHVELESEAFRSEQSWLDDKSLLGKVKLQYGLNCFGRKSEYFTNLAAKHGYEVTSFSSIASICQARFDDVCDGHLLVMTKPEPAKCG